MLLIGGSFLLIAAYCTLTVVAYPYQHEYREGAPLLPVKALLERKNPYSLEVEPASTYVYGILYPLLNYPISRALGVTLVHARVMSWLYLLATVVLVLLVAHRRGAGWGTAALAASLLPVTDPVKCLAQPVDLGILLCVASIVVPHWGRFARWSLLASILFSIAGFFAKPYFLIGTVYTAAYLCLFRSKAGALRYGMVALTLWALSLYLASRLLPTYLNDCLFMHYNVATDDPQHAMHQLKDYSGRNLWLLVAVLGLVLMSLARIRWRDLGLDLLRPGRPLITGVGMNLNFEVSALIALLVFMYKLGGHTGGGGGTYLNHLLSPLLVLVVADKLDAFPGWVAVKSAVVASLLVFLVQASRAQYEPVKRLRDNRRQIAALERALAPKRHVLNSSNTASLMIGQHKPVYDSGLSIYFASGESRYSQALVYGSAIGDRHQAYLKDIQTKVESGAFDAVLVSAYDQWKIPSSLSSHYVRKAIYPYPTLLDNLPVEFWERQKVSKEVPP
jgi:hypothetical protein